MLLNVLLLLLLEVKVVMMVPRFLLLLLLDAHVIVRRRHVGLLLLLMMMDNISSAAIEVASARCRSAVIVIVGVGLSGVPCGRCCCCLDVATTGQIMTITCRASGRCRWRRRQTDRWTVVVTKRSVVVVCIVAVVHRMEVV